VAADRTEDLLELEIGPPVHGGHCLARHEGRVVFVRHALPGERALVRVGDRRRRGYWRGDAVEILTPSPDRVPSVWPEAGPDGVGGGELAHVARPAQLVWKRDVLVESLVRIGGLDASHPLLSGLEVEAVPGEPADGTGTRTRIELTVDAAGRAGMHRYRSHEVVPLQRMPLAVEEITALGLLERRWPAGVRLDAVAPSLGDPVLLVDGEPVRGGRTHVRERVEVAGVEHRFRLAASGFWQVHRGAPALLAEGVLEAARPEPGARVVDAYSGAGLLSVPLAHAVGESGHVLAVEGAEQAGRDARRNAHGLPQLELRTADVGAALADLSERPDVVVLDPPRAGAGQAVVHRIADLGPARVVYVACDPAALARDARVLGERGYRMVALRGLDLFPHTHHVEAIATFEP